jgi:signal transduction histidine kinase
MSQVALPGRTSRWRDNLSKLGASIGTKIILPYLLLTLVVAGVGAYVVTNLVTGSMRERFNNQLLDAGRVVSETMVQYETDRLVVLRAVAGTQGVPEALAARDQTRLKGLVPQILANNQADAVELLDANGIEVYGWQRLVLSGHVDEYGNKRALVTQTPYGLMAFSVGPVYQDDQLVGAAMVGSYLDDMVRELSESAVAKVTLYDPSGKVLATTLGGGQTGVAEVLQVPADRYNTVIELLQETPNRYHTVVAGAENEVPLNQIDVLGQEYALAFGDWRLRGQSFGLFSVALPSNFIVTTAATSRNVLSLIFSLATVLVISIGFVIARRIIHPLDRLVQTSVAVASGDLGQRTGIQRKDEIGSLAVSFDVMTQRLAERNRELMEQASKLGAILNSIADGVIVLDMDGEIITSNPAAQQVLAEMRTEDPVRSLHELPADILVDVQELPQIDQLLTADGVYQPKSFSVGDRTLSGLAALVLTPDGEKLGRVVVLRDITREVESDRLKDEFITNISHELRTPLTAIKGYADLFMLMADGSVDERRVEFVRTIGENANQLLRHINELIDISQIQSKNLGLETERLRFSRLVGEVVEKWREPMEKKGLSLRARMSGGSLWVEGDRSRLTWAIDNLMNNALNYTMPGGKVEVRVFEEEGEARVEVADTGVGIAEVDQPYLFDRFFRAKNELTFGVRGVGLGLFITRSLIELHGGRVWAESELGVGSTFSIALPLIVNGDSRQ